LSGKAKGSRQFGKPVKKVRRVPKRIKQGTKRWSPKRPYQCKKCGQWFATLKEINLHYSANANHTRKKPKQRVTILKPFHEFSPEQQKKAIEIVNIISNPREFQMKIKKAMEAYVSRVRFR
jgi:hypothetical protein